MGQLLEKIFYKDYSHMVGENGLSENHAIQAVVDIATKARRGTGNRKGFCALISIDLRNAFNTTRWDVCVEAMMRKKVPDYLLRMIDDYLSDKSVILEGDKWLNSRCLKLAPKQTEALLVTDRRSFQCPKIVLGKYEQITTTKAIPCGAALTRLMPNIGGPREAKRRLVVSVVNSRLLYAAPVWTSALNNHAIQKKLFSAQRSVVLRIVSAYRTVSTSAVLVLASVPPIDLLAEEMKKTFCSVRSSPAY